MLLPTTLVGSYAQPEWLIDRAKLAGRFPSRDAAFGGMKAMGEGARIVRAELAPQ
jgi:methionine synthase II (cobalamin-independent)